MVLTHIKIALIYLVSASLWLAALFAQGHPGRTDAEGCHAGTEPRHCHDSKQSERPAQTNPGAPTRDTGRPAPRKTASEEEYNRRFMRDGQRGHGNPSRVHVWRWPQLHVKVDCETSTTVYEGGLDKRSSLDSLQQALFFSVLTGKRPAVVIYHTDGKEGRFEYRIRTACQKSGVRYEVFR